MFIFCSRRMRRRNDVGVWRLWTRAGLSNRLPETVFVPTRDMGHANNGRSGQSYSYANKGNFGQRRYLRLIVSTPTSITAAVLVKNLAEFSLASRHFLFDPLLWSKCLNTGGD